MYEVHVASALYIYIQNLICRACIRLYTGAPLLGTPILGTHYIGSCDPEVCGAERERERESSRMIQGRMH